jgi:hypothetical protein
MTALLHAIWRFLSWPFERVPICPRCHELLQPDSPAPFCSEQCRVQWFRIEEKFGGGG